MFSVFGHLRLWIVDFSLQLDLLIKHLKGSEEESEPAFESRADPKLCLLVKRKEIYQPQCEVSFQVDLDKTMILTVN